MSIINSIFYPIHNCEYIVLKLCKALRVPVTRNSIVKITLEHPDYPSMLTISDILRGMGVKNASAKISEYKNLAKLPAPFLAQIKNHDNDETLFSIIYKIDSEEVKWENPVKLSTETIPFVNFLELFTGYIQVYEKSNDVIGEKNYSKNAKQEKITQIINYSLLTVIPIITAILGVTVLNENGISGIFLIIYLLLLLLGSCVSGILILHEFNEFNPALNKICSGGQKTNCSAVLNSKGAKIFGINWSVIGFSYFLGSLIVLLITHLDTNIQRASATVSFLALPYTIYSFYYQSRIVKYWCPLCLAVQIILILVNVTALFGNFISINTFNPYSLISISTGIVVVFISVYLLLSVSEKAKISVSHLQSLQSIKHNPVVFDALLRSSKEICLGPSTQNLGIFLGNSKGTIHLLKVCNPYCGPCSEAHPILENLLKNNADIKMQIIYTVRDTDSDWRNKPVKTFLALNQKTDINRVSEALDIWYNGISLEDFNILFPIDQGDLNSQKSNIKEMRNWCDQVGIEYTPTFFINGKQVPRLYNAKDISYLLSV